MRRAKELMLLIGLLVNLASSKAEQFSRYDFPPNFVFGAGTSAYQVEGAALDDGRTPSILDTFAHSGRFAGNGDEACDEYHRYKEDVQLMVETGLDAYRFSISWSRLIPNGRGAINPKGLEYYNNLINELISQGIQPHVTLFHSDTPQALEDEYGGFLNRTIIEDFTAYADVCFKEFGDRVLHWTTINEANIFVFGGYDVGNTPPCRCSPPFSPEHCTTGNSTIEPYIAAHNILLAHASAARLYKEKYQIRQHGMIGFNLYALHFTPLRNTTDDEIAARRSYDFFIGWFMHPLVYGDYPEIMKKVGSPRIPVFSKYEADLVKGTFDFIGLNYYSIMMVEDDPKLLDMELRDFKADNAANWIFINYSTPMEGNPFLNTPWGLQKVLEHFKDVYGNPLIFIHENGQLSNYNASLNDISRIEYLEAHIGGLLDAIRNGSNTKGYFIWSFLDVYELLYGYEDSFGLYHIVFSDPSLRRYPKLSQKWYSRFLKGATTIRKQADYYVETFLRVS